MTRINYTILESIRFHKNAKKFQYEYVYGEEDAFLDEKKKKKSVEISSWKKLV